MSLLGHDHRLEELTVNEIVSLYPESVAVFNEMGIDACCGGAARVVEAAERDGVDPRVLLEALEEAIRR